MCIRDRGIVIGREVRHRRDLDLMDHVPNYNNIRMSGPRPEIGKLGRIFWANDVCIWVVSEEEAETVAVGVASPTVPRRVT